MCYVLSSPSDYLKVVGPVVSLHVSLLNYKAELIAACPTISTDSNIQRYDYLDMCNCDSVDMRNIV